MVLFATSNKHKFQEASQLLDMKITQLEFDYTEIRSESLEEVARDAVRAAYKRCREPVFVEDTGLFIKELNGFPGPYSGWVHGKIGSEGIIKLLDGVSNRSAYFEAFIGYMKDKEHVSLFHGKCPGTIALEPRGDDGFGYDSIFIPDGGHQTFAESIELKNKLSHRYKALLEFSKSISLRS
jgi:XTP/dITP diphosphohydrolase